MRTAIFIALAALAVPVSAATPREDGETRLQKLLEGRVAGAPVSCVSLSRLGSSEVIDRTAIVYHSGSRLYVNRPDNGAESLRSDDVMVTRTATGELCDVDTITMVDPSSHMLTGVVMLGHFVPYDRVRKPR